MLESAKKGGVDSTMGKPTRLRDAGNCESDVAKFCKGRPGLLANSTLPLLAESDARQWCGALLAYARGAEIECNLTRGHGGKCQHIYET